MKNYRVELTESKTINMDVEASSEEEARSIAEEQYYALSTDRDGDTETDFYVNDVTELSEIDTRWEM